MTFHSISTSRVIWLGFYALMAKEVRRFFRIWQQTLLPPLITTSLYFLIFGRIIGSQISPIQGLNFMVYIVPGLVMLSAITNSYSNVATSFFSAKFVGSLEEILISPMPLWTMFAAYASASMIRAFVTSAIILLCARFFTPYEIEHPLLMVYMLFIASLIFICLGFLNGMYAKSFDAVSIVPIFVITPLSYLGGIFYSIDSLPEPFKTISSLNPIRYLIDALRYSFYGISDLSLFASFTGLTLLAAAMLSSVLWMLSRGIGIRK